jgi:hypothetical protein
MQRSAEVGRTSCVIRPAERLERLAVALASMVAAMPDIVNELDNAGGQRLVHIISIDANRKRYTIIDPKRTPPKYWS